ncbi:hypothetical protein IVB38_34600 [Bradyrhizobium sp. 38]|uniref:hypothetical protein n=1 Tax=unclassified Bradyrhizobium TaxID=2631580 RepID=UPI001FFA0E81|nr:MULTISPECIES: hypothetical protein [unclassified Bradyrhizobium]MCK1341011.1 hypothetical protein [Bradyrhizobium sp. 38]MCK1780980.1 hypothetical protein [Bradyrhizobium sp. 132]
MRDDEREGGVQVLTGEAEVNGVALRDPQRFDRERDGVDLLADGLDRDDAGRRRRDRGRRVARVDAEVVFGAAGTPMAADVDSDGVSVCCTSA